MVPKGVLGPWVVMSEKPAKLAILYISIDYITLV